MADRHQDALFQAAEQQKQITALQAVCTNHEQSHTKLIEGAKRHEGVHKRERARHRVCKRRLTKT
jgi:hypothetical protein